MSRIAYVNGRYQSDSKSELDDNEVSRVDAWGVINAGVGIAALDGRWDVTLWGANLTDEYYWLAVTQNANTWVRLPGKSRTWGATLSWHF